MDVNYAPQSAGRRTYGDARRFEPCGAHPDVGLADAGTPQRIRVVACQDGRALDCDVAN